MPHPWRLPNRPGEAVTRVRGYGAQISHPRSLRRGAHKNIPGQLNVAHIGDSRLYLRRGDECHALTNDHTNAWNQWKKGEISEFAYRNHPRRSALYDALGGNHMSITPQVISHPLKSGDRILLCTDGVIDGLWESGIADELGKSGQPPELAENTMVRARQNSHHDDATLIVADIAKL